MKVYVSYLLEFLLRPNYSAEYAVPETADIGLLRTGALC